VVEVRTNICLQETIMDRFAEFKRNDHIKFGNYGLAIDDFWKNSSFDLTDPQRFGYQTYRHSLLPYSGRTDASTSNGLKLADVNCGKGWGLKYLQEEFFFSEIHGYQPDVELHSLATQNAPEAIIFNSSITQSNLNDHYDIVISVNSIMNETYPVEMFKEIYKRLKSGGLFIMVDKVKKSHDDEYRDWIRNMTNVIGFKHETNENVTTLSKNASNIVASDYRCNNLFGDVSWELGRGNTTIYRDYFRK